MSRCAKLLGGCMIFFRCLIGGCELRVLPGSCLLRRSVVYPPGVSEWVWRIFVLVPHATAWSCCRVVVYSEDPDVPDAAEHHHGSLFFFLFFLLDRVMMMQL
ncbi:hypothetical protein BZA05DRAFT_97999 [Tricharina praecox]|uniref:uncharacterized protein n=1 Tax=Tricharina praecox TaxID=43433 RepID=UPI002220F413|nr:uncharacterized protein BZA05DRAFT_97999 [Tricharina praecox]KAI5857504.1 hypothetical protein BZA05DRAFT_97999 [Tricharina praecox]